MADFVGECVDGYTKRPRQSEVTNFELSSPVNEQILGLQISMENAVVVAVGNTLHLSFFFVALIRNGKRPGVG